MGITALDIKLRKSQRLTDNPDGGGRMVAAEVVDGELNALFPDISTQDRVQGRVSMRKAFVHIDTPDTSVLYGAVGVLTEPPVDDDVFMTMFSTGSYSDVRSDARNRIESYITKGVESRFVLFGDHFIGQRALTMYCLRDAATPEINQTFALSVEAVGYPAQVQYVRVEDVVSRTTQSFVDVDGVFERDVVIITTTTALLHDFPGQEAYRLTSAKPPTRIRLTNVADASSYYSVKPLSLVAEPGDLSVKIDSPYVPLVPATQAETPVVDVLAGLGTVSLVQAGATGALTYSGSATFAAGVPVTRYLGNPIVRGSVSVVAGGATLVDNGQGALLAQGNAAWSGTVDYLAGAVSVANTASAGNMGVSITATPAGAVIAQGFSDRLPVSVLNRQNSYVLQLKPLPAAGTVAVDYRALGKWVRLTDSGTGQLAGAPGQGSGTVNYQTGSVILTLGALPDVDSDIIVSWGTGLVAERRDGDVAITTPALVVELDNGGVKPGTLALTWRAGGVDVLAVDNSAGSVTVAGVAVGTIDYAAGIVRARPSQLPDGNSGLTAAYTWAAEEAETFTPAHDINGFGSMDLGGPVRAGTVRASWPANLPIGNSSAGIRPRLVTLKVRDDGDGNIVATTAGDAAWSGTVGSINYTTGLLTLQLDDLAISDVAVPQYQRWSSFSNQLEQLVATSYARLTGTAVAAPGTPVSVSWVAAGGSETAATENHPLPPIEVDLTPGVVDTIVSGSVRLQVGGVVYVERSGSLFRDIDPLTGAGTFAGTLDPSTGIARLSSWPRATGNSISVTSLLTRFSAPGTARINFRTPGAPLRPGSFTLRATTLAGAQLTATANVSGLISGTGVRGDINWQTGSAVVEFGQLVTAAGNEFEPWFDPDAVVGGQIWRPTLVLPDSVFIGTVVYRSVPLNPGILGLDPVRLPEDGRVPAFKPGQTVLVHHTQSRSIANPAPGQVVNFGREGVARVEVRDADDVPVQDIWYAIDRAAGTLTFSDPINLAAYALPITIRDRVEDRVLVADAQITGEIALNRALTHDYPVGSYISTCLILGEANGSPDLQARVENLFDQETWTGAFSDLRIGDTTDAQYNDVTYPLVVDNENAITERWALVFTNATSFEVIGETVGQIATGSTTSDMAPVNPRTGEPYFTVDKDGWGGGWSAGNVVRFNTVGGLAPVWFIRTTLAGEMEAPFDGFRYETIGDANP